ncbi:MAG: hypothetical protein WA990_07180, partial [Rubrobacteraceae bacterium]
VPEDRIAEILTGPSENPEGPARQLLSEALEAGGADNITIVLVDVKKREERRPPSPASSPRGKAGGTEEMKAVSRPESLGTATQTAPRDRTRDRARTRDRSGESNRGAASEAPSSARRSRKTTRKKRRRGGVYRRAITGLLRAVAVVLVVLLALTPVYLWGSSRYFLDFEGGEVVAYQGLPYEVLGFKFNEEWRRPGIERSEVKGPYREPIGQQKLYTKSQVNDVLRDLRR